MGCDIGKSQPQKLVMVWDEDATDYNSDDLNKIINLCNLNLEYFNSFTKKPELDTVMIRIGAVGIAEGKTPAEVLYEDELLLSSTDKSKTRVSIDFIKISKYVSDTKTKTFQYISNNTHNVIEEQFYFGVNNLTENPVYDNLPVGAYVQEGSGYERAGIPVFKSEFKGAAVQYIPNTFADTEYDIKTNDGDFYVLPSHVRQLMAYVVTNITMLKILNEQTIADDVGSYNAGISGGFAGTFIEGTYRVTREQYVGTVVDQYEDKPIFSNSVMLNGTTKIGDHILLTVKDFITVINRVKARCKLLASQLYPAYYKELREILKVAGLDQSFKDLKYGGTIDSAMLNIQVPASKQFKKDLYGFLDINEIASFKYGKDIKDVTDGDRQNIKPEDTDKYFNHVFKLSEIIMQNDVSTLEASGDPRVEHYKEADNIVRIRNILSSGGNIDTKDNYALRMWYDNGTLYGRSNAAIWNIIKDLPAPTFKLGESCKAIVKETETDSETGQTRTYKATKYYGYKVDFEWWKRQSVSTKVGLLFMGMVFDMDTDNPCPYDQLIVLVATIIMACVIGPEAFAISQAAGWAFVASTVLSIGMQTGIIHGAQARYATWIAAALAIYTAYETIGSEAAKNAAATAANNPFYTGPAGVSWQTLTTQIANSSNAIISVISSEESYKFKDAYGDGQTELMKLTKKNREDDASNFVNRMRFEMSVSYGFTTGGNLYTHPHKDILMQYKQFSPYDNAYGFKVPTL